MLMQNLGEIGTPHNGREIGHDRAFDPFRMARLAFAHHLQGIRARLLALLGSDFDVREFLGVRAGWFQRSFACHGSGCYSWLTTLSAAAAFNFLFQI